MAAISSSDKQTKNYLNEDDVVVMLKVSDMMFRLAMDVDDIQIDTRIAIKKRQQAGNDDMWDVCSKMGKWWASRIYDDADGLARIATNLAGLSADPVANRVDIARTCLKLGKTLTRIMDNLELAGVAVQFARLDIIDLLSRAKNVRARVRTFSKCYKGVVIVDNVTKKKRKGEKVKGGGPVKKKSRIEMTTIKQKLFCAYCLLFLLTSRKLNVILSDHGIHNSGYRPLV